MNCPERDKNRSEIYRALARRQMLMNAVLPDVLDVHVRDLARHRANDVRGGFADAEQVADVAVHADERIIGEMLVFELQVFLGGFDKKARLRLDGWPYPGPIGIVERNEFLDREEVHLVDAWRHLGTARSESEMAELLQAPPQVEFDFDLYKLLKAQLAKRGKSVRTLTRA